MTLPIPSTLEREKEKLPYPPPHQDLHTLAQHICTGESTIENWVRLGQFPQPRKIGGKRLWVWKEVEKFIAGPDNPLAPVNQGEGIRDATKRVSQGG